MIQTASMLPVIIWDLACALANQQTTPAQESSTIRMDVNLVLVHAAVTNSAGQFVPGLTKQDFQLFIDGVSRPITVFERDDAAVAAGILVDNSASMIQKGSEVISAALAFARASNQQDEMFVVHFSDHIRLGLADDKPFTGSISELESALANFRAAGATALYDAVALGIHHLQQTKMERKILLIISDGGDNSSRVRFSDVVKLATRNGVIIYCVGIYDDADRDRSPRVLTQFANLSGGRAFFPAELKDVTDTCVKIARDIRQQYTVGFAGPADGEYHGIRVAVLAPGHENLTVQSRAGYFAPKP
jgi:Ca-activated chloride channel family protein